jgi:DNA modification methylase
MIKRIELDDLISLSEVQAISIDDIVYDKSTYSRTGGIDRNAVEDYSKNIITMPPIVINQNNKIVDGVHRYHACLKADQQSMNVKQIELPDEDIKLANLLIDIQSGVRHPVQDKKSIIIDLYDPQNSEQNKLLMEELGIPSSTFYDWTSKKRSLMQKQVNQAIAIDLLNPNLSQQQIAEQNGHTTDRTIRNFKKNIQEKIPNVGKISGEELQEADLDFLIDYKQFIENDLLLYNIWNTPKGDNNSHFGHFPLVFMKNLLYYHTQPFDLVYDPFAGSGTTIDACREMYRQCMVSDRNPDKSRPEIFEHDIAQGLPDGLPKPDMVFLDPPYWIQAEGLYSDSPNDLANMSLDNFYASMNKLFDNIYDRLINKIALVIQPTQYKNDMQFEDHIFKLNNMLQGKYKIEMRYILPYSTQQYNAQMVNKAKDERICLANNRDLIIWRLA